MGRYRMNTLNFNVLTIKRLILILLTVLAILFAGASLVESWKQPQIQSRLELYQTNLLLHAAQWQPEEKEPTPATLSLRETPATQQYQEARKSAQRNLKKSYQLENCDRNHHSQSSELLL